MREAGWYWVKVDDTADWQVAECRGDGTWLVTVDHPLEGFVADDTWVDRDFHRIFRFRIEEPIEEE